LEEVRELLSENIKVEYSNLGSFEGREEVLKHLRLHQNYDEQTVTVLNVLSYTEGNKTITAFIGQHMNLLADIPVIYPVVYGGKYVFVLDNQTGLIEEIRFVLEYQGENTFFLSHWKLAKNQRDYRPLDVFDPRKQWEQICKEPVEDRVRDTLRLLCWSLDTHNMSMLEKLVCPDAGLSREKTYSNGAIRGTGAEIGTWIEEIENYYDLNQYGYKIENMEQTEDGWRVTAQLLSPQRLNTKKMHNGNKYHSFFEEETTICLDQDLKLKEWESVKLSEIQYNGFSLLEM
jgi:hypothetical protein